LHTSVPFGGPLAVRSDRAGRDHHVAQVRGRETERVVARSLRANSWPYAEQTGAGRLGRDATRTALVTLTTGR